jgi:hypothetical protein
VAEHGRRGTAWLSSAVAGGEPAEGVELDLDATRDAEGNLISSLLCACRLKLDHGL